MMQKQYHSTPRVFHYHFASLGFYPLKTAKGQYCEDQEGAGSAEGSHTNGQEEMAGEDDREHSHQ
jgi:hypothetical protein